MYLASQDLIHRRHESLIAIFLPNAIAMVRVQLTDCPDYSTVVFVMERKKVEDRGEWFGWPCFSMIRSHVTEGKKKKKVF